MDVAADAREAEVLKSIVFDLTPLQAGVILTLPQTRVPGRYCAQNAVRHLNRAWKNRENDRDMAALRCLTAQEESATAIFHALRASGYANAKRIGLRNHVHKMALMTFVSAVNDFLAAGLEKAPLHDIEAQLARTEKGRQLSISFRVKEEGHEDERYFPEPPLNFSFAVNGGAPDFRREMELFVKASATETAKTLEQYLKEQKELRERLLYASNEGLNQLEGDVEKFCRESQRKVLRNLVLFLLIDQHPEPQLFVQQCVDAFVEMVCANNRVREAAETEERLNEELQSGRC